MDCVARVYVCVFNFLPSMMIDHDGFIIPYHDRVRDPHSKGVGLNRSSVCLAAPDGRNWS